jgi:superfamily II DNA or RNA helicase
MLTPDNISVNHTFYNNIEFGDTKIQTVSKILKNDDPAPNGKINTQLTILPTKTAREIQDYFKERIVYYMVEEEKPDPLNPNANAFPKYVEKIYFAFPTTAGERNRYISKFLNVEKLQCKNDTLDCTNPFYSKENEYIWKNTTIKTDSILNIIATREITPENEEISYTINPAYNFRNFGKRNSPTFKYIIYCNYEINIKKLKEELIKAGIKEKYIGIIKGSTSGSDRKTIASNYDSGLIKIVILSKAGEEGVDFKRTGVIILADGVWTSSEYEQILGRAVRKNSNVPSADDPNTKIPRLIECISI